MQTTAAQAKNLCSFIDGFLLLVFLVVRGAPAQKGRRVQGRNGHGRRVEHRHVGNRAGDVARVVQSHRHVGLGERGRIVDAVPPP